MAIVLCCRFALFEIQPTHGRTDMQHESKAALSGSPSSVAVTGILSNPNFRLVLRALEQRNGVKELAEPEVTKVTCSFGSVNRSFYNETFTLPVTKK